MYVHCRMQALCLFNGSLTGRGMHGIGHGAENLYGKKKSTKLPLITNLN